MSDEREPDHTDAGEGRDVASGGHAEEQPGSGSPHDQGADKGGTGEATEKSSDSGRDSDAGTATGNPDAAG